MRRFAMAAFAVLASWLTVMHAAESAPVEQWTGDYLYIVCQNAYAPETQTINEAKNLSDISWCNGASTMASEALVLIHNYFDGIFPKTIDSSNTQEVTRYFAFILSFGSEVCLPDNANNQILALVISKFAREHPQYLTMPSLTFAGLALQSAFPCNRIK